jgi:hypothetical protein
VLDELSNQTFQHWAERSALSIIEASGAQLDAALQRKRPCVLFRPALTLDGDQWCALYGANLQDGVAGFGDSPADAMADFDQKWAKPIKKAESAALDEMMGRKDWPASLSQIKAAGREQA